MSERFVAFLNHFREDKPHSNNATVYAVHTLPASLFTKPVFLRLFELQPRLGQQIFLAIPGVRHKDRCKNKKKNKIKILFLVMNVTF